MAGPAPSSPESERQVPLPPAFKYVLIIISALTLLLLVVMIGIAATGATNEASQDLFDTSSTGFKIGFGAIVGLLGGKRL